MSAGAGTAAIRTTAVGKRYRDRWALRDCTLEVPEGRICGLVGVNGAGKTTLLRILTGLTPASTGRAEVAGREPADDPAFLADIGYLAQDIALYRRWTVEDHFAMGAHLNQRWDGGPARERLRARNIPLDQRAGTLSGGQRAQVGLALALAKRPRVLLLDEPVAALDPLARRGFMATLGEAVAEGDLTIVLSSHLVADLERICDHVVVLAESRTVLAADIDDVLANHRLLTSESRDPHTLAATHTVLRAERMRRQVNVWARLSGPILDPAWEVAELDLEEILLTYLGLGATDRPATVRAVSA